MQIVDLVGCESAWQFSWILGSAVSLAASSAGMAMTLMWRRPSPPMCMPSATCCRPRSVSPVAIQVGVMSTVRSTYWKADVSSLPYMGSRCCTWLSPRQCLANLSSTAGSLSVVNFCGAWLA